MTDKNIVLIGMPGSGKTTLGEIIHKRLQIKFIDMDAFIEHKHGMTIPELFMHGEEYFRKLESEAVQKLSCKKSTIIATGGGVVKNHLNMQYLKKNGIIIFIDRPVKNIINDINISNRPLLKDGVQMLYSIFNERYELYNKYCDFRIINNMNIEHAVEEIMKVIK